MAATEQTVMAVIRASRPTFRSRADKAAFSVHAVFLASGYVLHATGSSAFADNALLSTSTDEVGIDNWNEDEDKYAFLYSSPERESKKVLMKCLVMSDHVIVDVVKEGGSRPQRLEFDVFEYVDYNGGTMYHSMFKNMGRLVAHVNLVILILRKLDGPSAASSSNRHSRSQTRLRYDRDRLTEGIYVPEGTYASRLPTRFMVPPTPGFGGGDLFPGPQAGMYPWGGFGGGGMLMGPHDPRFFGGGIGEPGLPGGVPGGFRGGGMLMGPHDPRFFGGGIGEPGLPGGLPNPQRPGRGIHQDLERFHGARPRGPGRGTHPDFPHFHSARPQRPGRGNHPDLERFHDARPWM